MTNTPMDQVLNVAYYIGAPATAAIVGVLATLYGVQKYGWGSSHVNGTSGSKPVDFWRTEIRDSVDKSVRVAVIPILDRQTDILDEMRVAITKLVTLAESRERRRGD